MEKLCSIQEIALVEKKGDGRMRTRISGGMRNRGE